MKDISRNLQNLSKTKIKKFVPKNFSRNFTKQKNDHLVKINKKCKTQIFSHQPSLKLFNLFQNTHSQKCKFSRSYHFNTTLIQKKTLNNKYLNNQNNKLIQNNSHLTHNNQFLTQNYLIQNKYEIQKKNRSFSNTNINNIDETNLNKNTKNENTTHFGFSTIPESEKEEKVKQVFHSVAGKYDLMNDLMSGGLHRLWKTEFLRTLGPTPGMKLLDVAGGTGDIAFKFLEMVEQSPMFVQNIDKEEMKTKVTVCDINASMLKVGEQRGFERGYKKDGNPSISWIEGNAESLPFASNSFDAYTIAFGIRNCTHVSKVLEESYRVLKPGGRLCVLEFSHVDKDKTFGTVGNQILNQFYEAYSFNIIPQIGQMVTGDRDSYQYLVESIRKFPDQYTFAKMIQDQGFKMVNFQNLTFGVVAIHSGFKIE